MKRFLNSDNYHYFIHVLFHMGDMEVDNLLHYDDYADFVTALSSKMQEINDSLYRNYPDAYINTSHHVLRGNRGEIYLKNGDETDTTQYSSEDLWDDIKRKMKELKGNSTIGKPEIDELQTLLKLFNDFVSTITAKCDGLNKGSLKVVIRASELDQFAPYFIDFLLNKANSDDDFVSEKLQPDKELLKSFQRRIKSESFPKSNFEVGQFLEWIHFYKSLQELTDQWVNYQLN